MQINHNSLKPHLNSVNTYLGLFELTVMLFALAIPLVGRYIDYRSHPEDQPEAKEVKERSLLAQKMGCYYGEATHRTVPGGFYGKTISGHFWELVLERAHTDNGLGERFLVWQVQALQSVRKEFELSSGIEFETARRAKPTFARYLTAPIAKLFGRGAAHDDLKFLKNARFQPLSSALLQRQFKAMARDAFAVGSLINPQVEALLLNWPYTPDKTFNAPYNIKIVRDRASLRILCDIDDHGAPICEHVIKLGLELAALIEHPELRNYDIK
jgi:AraC-like DNA-binding protein